MVPKSKDWDLNVAPECLAKHCLNSLRRSTTDFVPYHLDTLGKVQSLDTLTELSDQDPSKGEKCVFSHVITFKQYLSEYTLVEVMLISPTFFWALSKHWAKLRSPSNCTIEAMHSFTSGRKRTKTWSLVSRLIKAMQLTRIVLTMNSWNLGVRRGQARRIRTY